LIRGMSFSYPLSLTPFKCAPQNPASNSAFESLVAYTPPSLTVTSLLYFSKKAPCVSYYVLFRQITDCKAASFLLVPPTFRTRKDDYFNFTAVSPIFTIKKDATTYPISFCTPAVCFTPPSTSSSSQIRFDAAPVVLPPLRFFFFFVLSNRLVGPFRRLELFFATGQTFPLPLAAVI